MRAVIVETVGGDRRTTVAEVAEPDHPGAGEVLIRVHAAALDRVDAFIRRGSHGMRDIAEEPLGRDMAGLIEAVGPEVDHLRVGDRVVATGRGAHAELAVAPAVHTVPIPDGWDFVDAAALPTAGRTAYAAVVELAGVTAADRVLVTAAGGGVGSCAVQMCLSRGAEVIASVGSEWKEQRAREAGASYVVRHDRPGWGDRLRDEVGSVSAVIETTGAHAWPDALAALGDDGVLVCCGVSSGHRVDLHIGRLMTRGWRVLGIGRPDRGVISEHIRATLRTYDEAGIRPVIDRVLPLELSEEAHRLMEESAFYGRIVLTP